MTETIRLGTFRGIRIGVHWSVLFIAWLLAWGLATQLLPATSPGSSAVVYWAAGIGVAMLFFASLLAHELAHALFARRAGIKVQGITLWLLGGVAAIEGEAPTPGHELRIAASGPLTSAALGLGFLATTVALGSAGGPALLVESLAWLARVNLILAAFNLLPGAPLDGGRIVRAIAWRLGRDRLRASLLAARLGRMLGFALMALGLAEVVLGANLGGLWTVAIGLFMTSAAAAERNQEVVHEALTSLRVRDVMLPDPLRVPAGITVDVFLEGVLRAQRQSAALVVEAGGAPLGVAGLGEIRRMPTRARHDARVRDIAIPHETVPVVGPDEVVLDALERTGANRSPIPYLIVLDQGEVVGLLSAADLARTIEARAHDLEGRGRPEVRPAGH
jgi:Zn-dependent protease/CBS domain-containing protein